MLRSRFLSRILGIVKVYVVELMILRVGRNKTRFVPVRYYQNQMVNKKHPMYGKKHSEETKKHWSQIRKGKKMPEETRLKMIGRTPWNKGKTIKDDPRIKKTAQSEATGLTFRGRKHTPETRRKISETAKAKREQHHLWRGGVSDINKKIRNGVEYKLWRDSVFERDKYTCIWCGQKGGKLNADHIKPFALFPELRFAIDNGRTLCVECHKKTDTYAQQYNQLKKIYKINK
jgi:5-methylcytosine-specific restriction endonuclease McrA